MLHNKKRKVEDNHHKGITKPKMAKLSLQKKKYNSIIEQNRKKITKNRKCYLFRK